MKLQDLGDGWYLNQDGDSLELMDGTTMVAWMCVSLGDEFHFNDEYGGEVPMSHIEAFVDMWRSNFKRDR